MISPNSKYIEQRLSEIKNRKAKNAFLESIMSDPTATILHESNGHRTTLFRGNKGPKTGTWERTKKMAFELNNNGIDVAFLPELLNGTCADSLIHTGKTFKLADFKYCVTKRSSTLASELEHGFKQAETVILKLEHIDSGLINEAIDYLIRNKIPYGNILLINKYGRVRIITYKDIRNKGYIRKTKGFL